MMSVGNKPLSFLLAVPVTLSLTEITDIVSSHFSCCRDLKIPFIFISASQYLLLGIQLLLDLLKALIKKAMLLYPTLDVLNSFAIEFKYLN